MFDHVLMVDQGSKDGSAAIAASEAPASWKLFYTLSAAHLAAAALTASSDAWLVHLNVRDFVVHPNLRARLAEQAQAQVSVSATGQAAAAAASSPSTLYLPSYTSACEEGGKQLPPPPAATSALSPLLHCTRLRLSSSAVVAVAAGGQAAAAAKGSTREVESSGFVARFPREWEKPGVDAEVVDLRVVATGARVDSAAATAAQSAQAAWYATFAQDAPLVFSSA